MTNSNKRPVAAAALLAVFGTNAVPFAAPAAVVITEVMANPSGTDTDVEWLEVYNNGAAAVDLTGYKVGDAPAAGTTAGGEGMYYFPDGFVIAAGQVVTIAQTSTGSTDATGAKVSSGFNGLFGLKPTFEIIDTDPDVPQLTTKYTAWATGTIALANGGDEVLILDAADAIVDAMNYGTSTTYFTGGLDLSDTNDSAERQYADVDTGTGADWVRHGTLATATPGRVTLAPIPEPATAGLATVAAAGLLLRRRRGGREGR